MRFFQIKNKFFIALIIILIFLALYFFQKEVKNIFYLVSSPFQKTLWGAGERMSNFFEGIINAENLKKENEGMKLKIDELLVENINLQELKKENENLRGALGIGLEKDFDLIFAQINGKNISQDFILINKGSKDGISLNQPVITQEKILVGRISEVFNRFAKVMLISNKESFFDAEIVNKEIIGVVKGENNLKLILKSVPRESEIKEGDLVITSALAGVFPRGLLVGQVSKIKKSDVDIDQQAELIPAFNIVETDKLFIITNIND